LDNTENNQAHYYDGQTVSPEKGVLRVDFDGIKFISDDLIKEYIFKFEEIENIVQYPDSCHIELMTESLSVSKKIKIYNAELKKQIETLWLKNKQSGKEKIAYKLHNLNFKKIFLISLIVIPAFSASILFLFFNAFRIIPKSYDVYIGNSVYEKIVTQLRLKECQNTELKEAVYDILKRIPKDQDIFQYSILIADSDMVNALALPGGKMIVFHELIEKSDSPEELAGVLAHEISHIEKRHGVQQMIRTLGFSFLVSIFIGGFAEGFETIETAAEIGATLLFFKYSRNFEEEADKTALQKLIKGHINPEGFLLFFEKLDKLEKETLEKIADTEEDKETFYRVSDWISTHPASKDRIKNIKSALPSEKPANMPFSSANSWSALKLKCKE